MFFSKLFSRNYLHYVEKGDKHLASERYADARDAFKEALIKMKDNSESISEISSVESKICFAGNKLAEMNLLEAQHAINSGDFLKAVDHLNLVNELTESEIYREKAEHLHSKIVYPNQTNNLINNNNCTSCKSPTHEIAGNVQEYDNQLSNTDRFNLLINLLPGDLPERYEKLGEKFASCYLLIDEGKDSEALVVLEELLLLSENDILLYETALINYRAGRISECESMLLRSIKLNENNPLSNMALVHFLVDNGRWSEAINILESLVNKNILVDQASLLLGDVYQLSGNEDAAFEQWSSAMLFPSSAKGAAERLIPLLNNRGRAEEAQYLAKRYLKSCC
jgi:tetratricopeptide (TPR) repeat protein